MESANAIEFRHTQKLKYAKSSRAIDDESLYRMFVL